MRSEVGCHRTRNHHTHVTPLQAEPLMTAENPLLGGSRGNGPQKEQVTGDAVTS
jgi:hypothetical protein